MKYLDFCAIRKAKRPKKKFSDSKITSEFISQIFNNTNLCYFTSIPYINAGYDKFCQISLFLKVKFFYL